MVFVQLVCETREHTSLQNIDALLDDFIEALKSYHGYDISNSYQSHQGVLQYFGFVYVP